MKTDLITTLDLIDYAVFAGKPHNTACELIESNPALMTHVWELGRASFKLEDFDSPRKAEMFFEKVLENKGMTKRKEVVREERV